MNGKRKLAEKYFAAEAKQPFSSSYFNGQVENCFGPLFSCISSSIQFCEAMHKKCVGKLVFVLTIVLAEVESVIGFPVLLIFIADDINVR